jgi:hypothetical protein
VQVDVAVMSAGHQGMSAFTLLTGEPSTFPIPEGDVTIRFSAKGRTTETMLPARVLDPALAVDIVTEGANDFLWAFGFHRAVSIQALRVKTAPAPRLDWPKP